MYVKERGPIAAALIFFFLSIFVAHAGEVNRGSLSFESRVSYQRALEEVYWSHRIWPKDNPMPKPPLSRVMSDAAISAKVDDYLRQSNALEAIWHRPITQEQLQAEIDRMTVQSKDPQMLRELFAALGNDPHVIAECLARPALVDRLIHQWYSSDPRFHGDLRKQAETELQRYGFSDRKKILGEYSESLIQKRNENGRAAAQGSVDLDEQEWSDFTTNLKATFHNRLAVQRLSSLQEDDSRFYVIGIAENAPDRIRLATIQWTKQSFTSWWAENKERIPQQIPEPAGFYALPKSAVTSCVDDKWQATDNGPPSARGLHPAIWTGTEMIVWGGYGSAGPVNTGSRYSLSTDTWTPTTMSNAPQARGYETAVWTGTEMIVWGGYNGAAIATGGRYNPSTDSWTATDTVTAPTPRYYHTAVWTGTQMIVFGGTNGSVQLNTGSRYDPGTNLWNATDTITNPVGRQQHTAVWTGTRMIVWGGYNGSVSTNTGSRYDPVNNVWSATDTTSLQLPGGRQSHTAVWTGSQMIVWGGINGGTYWNTGGRYDPTNDTWNSMDTTTAPVGRAFHTAVWTGTEMIIWGGNSASSPWVKSGGRYDPVNNTWIATSGSAPAARRYHTAVWTGTEMIVWGGESDIGGGSTYVNTGGRYNPTSNTWVATANSPAPEARFYHTGVWTGSEMIVWGGYNNTVNLNTGKRYDPALNSWTAMDLSAAPVARRFHTAVWSGEEMIVWGGYDNSGNASNTGARYNPSSNTWIATTLNNAPLARYYHTAVWTGTEMIIWGGNIGNSYLGARYNPVTDTWLATDSSTISSSQSRYYHTAVWTGTDMIVWGGCSSVGAGCPLNTGLKYNVANDEWTATSGVSVPSARMFHTAVWTGSKMIVWGGSGLNTGGAYDPVLNSWIATDTATAPTARQNHSAIWTGSRMIVWGGDNPLNTGSRYDPVANSWSATSLVNVPDARYYHTAIWTGNQMIVWGGYTSTAQTSTGGLYCSGGFYASIADSPSPAFFGSNLSYTITVTNTSGVTANNVVVSDTSYGSSFSFVSATPSQGSCSGTSPVSCNLGTINSSASATIVVVLTPLTTGSIINVANISSSNLLGDSATKITPIYPGVSINDVSVAEGNSSTATLTFTVALNTSFAQAVTVNYQPVDVTAFDGSDYIGASGTITFSPGQTNKTLNIKATGDVTYEANETFQVQLSSPVHAGLLDSQGIGTITNDDNPPGVSISDRTVYEGNAGTTNANFTVSLSSAAGVAVTVNYTTANGTATSGSDYSSASGTLTIPAGDVTGVISVSVTGDVIQESDETFFVNLSNPTNSTLVDSQGLGMILNDDSDACITPDERIYLYSVTLDINNNPVLSFQDFNQPNEVTGYNIYRSATPAPAHDPAWILKASNIVDGDASLANIQWVDFSGDPGTFYYQVVAYNNVCSGEGPW